MVQFQRLCSRHPRLRVKPLLFCFNGRKGSQTQIQQPFALIPLGVALFIVQSHWAIFGSQFLAATGAQNVSWRHFQAKNEETERQLSSYLRI